MSQRAFLLYLPVYHAGHRRLFAQYPQVKTIYLLPPQLLQEWAPTAKDIHALAVAEMAALLKALGRFEQVKIVGDAKITATEVIVGEDEAVLAWAKQNLAGIKIIPEKIFLRWDKKRALQKKPPGGEKITPEKLPAKWQKILTQAVAEGEKSSDWWRRVGAVLILADGQIITTHNTHLPESETPNIVGDVRSQFHQGDHWELTSAIHAEALAIATAAKQGRTTAGAEILVTDFPCPTCAKLIAAAGLKTVYYHRGYALLDGADILRSFGIAIKRL